LTAFLVTLAALAITVVAGALLLHRRQHRLVFRSGHARITPEDAQQVASDHAGEELSVEVEGARLHGFFMPAAGDAPAATAPAPAPTLIYQGGNSETLAQRVPQLNHLRELGWNVVLVCYRGFGLSTGIAKSAVVLADALTVFDHVVADARVDQTCIVVWGRSIGTGVACHVAAHRELAGVVLACPFARLSDVAQLHYPWLPVHRYFTEEMDSLAHAPGITTPAILLHGDLDSVVPLHQAEMLAAAWNPEPRLVILKGRGHSDLQLEPAYHHETVRFLEGLRG